MMGMEDAYFMNAISMILTTQIKLITTTLQKAKAMMKLRVQTIITKYGKKEARILRREVENLNCNTWTSWAVN